MKKLIYTCLLALLISSCGKTPINGKLDGMWQLTQIDTVNGGSNLQIKKQQIYYSVQLKLITLRGMSGSPSLIGRFNQSIDSLLIYNLVTGGSEKPCTPQATAFYGLSGTEERFGIEALTSEKMILKSKVARLFFRKF